MPTNSEPHNKADKKGRFVMNAGEIILEQMGGRGRLNAMVAAHNLVATDEGELSFSFELCKECNSVRVKLNWMDLYDMTFYQDGEVLKTIEGLQWDQLRPVFEEVTGLRLWIRL